METGGFQFAAATSHEESLSRAVVECAGQLHAKLGAMPDLLHLLVSVDTHADNIHLAPQVTHNLPVSCTPVLVFTANLPSGGVR
jgi:small ligand-binding sensory domain FIST